MDLTVAICTHRRYKGAAKALESLLAQKSTGRFQILVIDSSPAPSLSAESALGTLVSSSSNVRVITEPRIGVSNARNRALLMCQSSRLAFLDDDCIASPQWISRLQSSFEESGDAVGAVGGRVKLQWEGSPPEWTCPQLCDFLSQLDCGDSRVELLHPRYIIGGNVIYSVERLRRAGGFITHLGRIGDVLLSNEEIGAIYALRRIGARIFYDPLAEVVHHVDPGRVDHTWFRKRVFWQAVSDALLMATETEFRPPLASLTELQPMLERLHLQSLLFNSMSPAAFWEQLKQVYALTTILMHGVIPWNEPESASAWNNTTML